MVYTQGPLWPIMDSTAIPAKVRGPRARPRGCWMCCPYTPIIKMKKLTKKFGFTLASSNPLSYRRPHSPCLVSSPSNLLPAPPTPSARPTRTHPETQSHWPCRPSAPDRSRPHMDLLEKSRLSTAQRSPLSHLHSLLSLSIILSYIYIHPIISSPYHSFSLSYTHTPLS